MFFPSEFTDDNPDCNSNDESDKPDPSGGSTTVKRLKLVVPLVFAIITAGVVVFGMYLRRRQNADFLTSFESDKVTIENEIAARIGMSMSVLDTFATGMVSSLAFHQSFPLMIPPNYALLAAKLRSLTPLLSLEMSPIILHEQREEYEKQMASAFYTIENMSSIVEETDPNCNDLKRIELNPGPYIFDSLEAHASSSNDTAWLRSPDAEYYAPTWMSYPAFEVAPFNWNVLSSYPGSTLKRTPVISRAMMPDTINKRELRKETEKGPVSLAIYPIVNESASRLVVKEEDINSTMPLGIVWSAFRWSDTVSDVSTVGDLVLVFSSSCNEDVFSYSISNRNVTFLGRGDRHDSSTPSTSLEQVAEITCSLDDDDRYTGLRLGDQVCSFNVTIYPTKSYVAKFLNNTPLCVVLGSIFGFLILCVLFFSYTAYVHYQQQKIIKKANRSDAIVQSLFPDTVRERLYEDKWNDPIIRTLLSTGHSDKHLMEFNDREDPIADLFPSCTVVFADFSGFTAWSSTREPTQVIILLETVFRAFDELADRRGIFKVESVADCWLGVAGLPVHRSDHALAISRFAIDCVQCFKRLTKTLEVRLGPDTTDLSLRVGIHSGQVTAGVLRGKVIRFQLFGDTVNTASRMESTGKPGMIQLSEQSAELLRQAGKEHWLTKRSEPVIAKGKGMMTTYWLRRRRRTIDTSGSDLSDFEDEYWREVENVSEFDSAVLGPTSNKQHRLIKWTGGILMKNLRAMKTSVSESPVDSEAWKAVDEADVRQPGSKMVFDEVREIIYLPQEEERIAYPSKYVCLDPEVEMQLLDFLDEIANLYNENPFHCHSHATHVTMSVSKLLSRIKAPKTESVCDETKSLEDDNTYGILDPLTQFACVFSALIHDVDHPGVSNTQLCKERKDLADRYNNQSVAEQHSLDVAFKLLENNRFNNLRRAIYRTRQEKQRFRSLVVNMVMATDIMDKDLKNLRNKRWERAFSDHQHEELEVHRVNRKATIVIEHIIQASDVAHTMQHWHIYRKVCLCCHCWPFHILNNFLKWNQRLFEEIYKAFLDGRSSCDPSEFWYKGELGFFDNYIIPLAKKLQECGVLGVSGDEYLNYAVSNRAEWAAKGKAVVAEMKESAREKFRASIV